jgi:hypothetical protein
MHPRGSTVTDSTSPDGATRYKIHHDRQTAATRANVVVGTHNVHERHSQRAARAREENPDDLVPGVHRVAALAKRWLLGTHQGSVDVAHLPNYMNEFVFRFNRRRSGSRGLLFYRLWNSP